MGEARDDHEPEGVAAAFEDVEEVVDARSHCPDGRGEGVERGHPPSA